MKKTNILSIIQAHNNLNPELFNDYLNYFNTSMKGGELNDLEIFVNSLLKKTENVDEFDNYYLGYKIPQISKEFDLLRFGENYTINIELKSTSTKEKIKKQLTRNKYYLDFLGENILCFTFISAEKKLFRLDNNNDIIEEKPEELLKVLKLQKVKSIENVDSLFNPSNYLVSPFNSTEKFVLNKFFLTNHQEEIKLKSLKDINDVSKSSFISIIGKAGTGKTLLTYDIVKECMSKKMNVLIIHCGLLNEGHYKLRDEYGWDIIPAKNTYHKDISNYSLVIMDEVQRVYPNQLKHIIKEVTTHKKSCIFSYDKQQCLRSTEVNNNIELQIESIVNPLKFQLTEKIRTNKEIASFIKCILDNGRQIDKLGKPNVELNYFKTYNEAIEHIKYLQDKGWKTINYTPSSRHNLPYDNLRIGEQDNAHSVIGQEFDKVIAVVDSFFYYNNENKLSTKNYKNRPYYHPTKMLLQIMTRTRRKLNFIVVDNEEILERCIAILNPK
ncbi:ATP-binding protein [Thalassobellus sediminis]|uniref:ATP-binding protein n=1 Tax=Thalassobellus sediminis TaxID=3367753 RepID=UPI0037B963EA